MRTISSAHFQCFKRLILLLHMTLFNVAVGIWLIWWCEFGSLVLMGHVSTEFCSKACLAEEEFIGGWLTLELVHPDEDDAERRLGTDHVACNISLLLWR